MSLLSAESPHQFFRQSADFHLVCDPLATSMDVFMPSCLGLPTNVSHPRIDPLRHILLSRFSSFCMPVTWYDATVDNISDPRQYSFGAGRATALQTRKAYAAAHRSPVF